MNAPQQPLTLQEIVNATYRNAREVNRALEFIAANAFLISPSTMIAAIPPGFEVSFNVVKFDPSSDAHSVGSGKVSLGGASLSKLGNAAGIRWINERSGRIDPNLDPNYVEYHAEGEWRGLDGQWIQLPGKQARFDLRDGSATVAKIRDETKVVGLSDEQAEWKRYENVRNKRWKIVELAETGAQLRVIRYACQTRAYTPHELLTKPFVCVRVIFTGRDEDPLMEAENKRVIREHAMASRSAMFAPIAPRARALTVGRPAPRQLPPVGSDVADGDFYDLDAIDTTAAPAPSASPVACTYCGSFDDVSHVSTPRGTLPVCGDQACYERASTGVSVQASQVDPPAKTPSQPPPAQPRPNDPRTPASSPAYPSASTSPTPPGASRPAAPAPPSPPPGGRAAGPAARNEAVRPSGFTIPGGRSKGQAIEDAEESDVRYWLKRRMDDLQSDPNGRFADTNRKWIDAARLELDRRDGIPY